MVYRAGEQRTATIIMHSTWVPQRDLSICPPPPFSCACMPGYDRFLLPFPATVCVMGIGRRRGEGTHPVAHMSWARRGGGGGQNVWPWKEEEERKVRRWETRTEQKQKKRLERTPRPHLTPRYSDRETRTHFMYRLAAGIWFAELNCLDCKKKWRPFCSDHSTWSNLQLIPSSNNSFPFQDQRPHRRQGWGKLNRADVGDRRGTSTFDELRSGGGFEVISCGWKKKEEKRLSLKWVQKRVSLKVAEGEENLYLEDISRLPFCLSFRGTLREEKGRES